MYLAPANGYGTQWRHKILCLLVQATGKSSKIQSFINWNYIKTNLRPESFPNDQKNNECSLAEIHFGHEAVADMASSFVSKTVQDKSKTSHVIGNFSRDINTVVIIKYADMIYPISV